MPNRSADADDGEHAELAKAEKDIAAGEKRLAEQASRIREMKFRGEDTEEAERIRRNYEEVLRTFRAHRRIIIDTINRRL